MHELYDELIASGCKTDSHESDLYVEDTEKAREIIERHMKSGEALNSRKFVSQSDGKTWIELPFSYLPFWRRRSKAT